MVPAGPEDSSPVMSRVSTEKIMSHLFIGFCARNRAVFNHQLDQYKTATLGGGPARPFFSYYVDTETLVFEEDGGLKADLKLKCCHRKDPTGYKPP